MTGADLLVKTLLENNVEYIFGHPGDETAIFKSLFSKKIKFITTRHEQGAAFMADAYARTSGKFGVCYSTLGPGGTNLMTGIANAFLDRSPVIAFSDQVELSELHKGAHQYLDLTKIFEPITKFAVTVENAEMIPNILNDALQIALRERPGPVHITLPKDVLRSEVYQFPNSKKFAAEIPKKIINKKLLNIVAKLLNESKAPIAIVGNLVNRKKLNKSLLKFIEMHNIPTFTTYMGKGAIPESHPLSLGVMSRHAKNQLIEIFEKANLVILIGFDYVEGIKPDIWKMGNKKSVISFEDSIHTEGIFYKPDIIISKLEAETLDYIIPINHTLSSKLWINVPKVRKEIAKKIRSKNVKSKNKLTPEDIMDAISSLGQKWIVTADVGLNKYAVGLCLKTDRPNSVFFSNGLSSMGFSVPAAIGVKLANPKSTVISISGDGGFLMNLQELETSTRSGTNITFIVFKDNNLGLIKRMHLNEFNNHIGVEIGNPDFVKLAQAFGMKGAYIRTKAEFKTALKKAIKSKKSWILEIPITYKSWLE
ncbi:MAG: Acetolactate synthase [Candidatus Curtissbacteria bacterium GW2011_GWA1_40_16]|uniref:Acetolactate synthase n=1 Tax=Candidatus Curtissbacteria bacterium GW2011_GWA1_40_16 TaxID=1618405 RepID=A0A0G0RCX5_9BACT|nr:MAG: Acetolactate synthase [Candidatus Curtissbacteria bacterium GW2011_GWA1_40_16]